MFEAVTNKYYALNYKSKDYSIGLLIITPRTFLVCKKLSITGKG